MHQGRTHMTNITRQIYNHISAKYTVNGVPSAKSDVGGSEKSDTSLASCLMRLAHPQHTPGQTFTQDDIMAEIAINIIGQGSVPWTVSWAL